MSEDDRLNDKDIRRAIFQCFSGNSEAQRIIEEFPMGDSRADMLLITRTKLIGMEIKSDRDTFVRLGRQVKDYERFFDYNYLEHYGENYFQPVEGATQKDPEAIIRSGYLETSNVQVVSEMVEMISVSRQYESNQKLIQTIDSSLEIAANRLGKV